MGKCALDRITADTALELASHGVTVVSVWPGFVRTERIDIGAAIGLVPDTPRPRARRSRRASRAGPSSRSPTDADVARWSGQAVSVRDLADEYGFRDVDGSLPAGPLRHRTT